MSVSTRGVARIKHRETGEIHEIEADELDWQEGAADERQMGLEIGHFAEVEHPELGRLSWEIWEYPVGMENMQDVHVGGHVLIDNFRLSIGGGLDEDDYRSRVDELVTWFFARYEDPAERTPYESAEGGYQWIWGGPFDAREELTENFPDDDPNLIEAAVRRIERDGLKEWAPVSSRDDYDDERTDGEDGEIDLSVVAEGLHQALRDIPRQLPGPAFAPTSDGRLDVTGWNDEAGPQSLARADDPLVDALRDAVDDLIAALAGTNAHPDLLGEARRYAQALSGAEVSVAQMFARGIALENTAQVADDEVRRDNRPALPPEARRQLKTLLDVHAAFIGSTPMGRALVDAAAAYQGPRAATEELRAAVRQIADTVAQAPTLFAESAVEAAREAASTVATGPHPDRSTWSSLLTLRGLVATVGSLLALAAAESILSLVTSAVTASVPGTLAVQAGGAIITAAGQFMLANAAQLQVLAVALGSEAPWLPQVAHIFEWLRRQSKL